MARAGTLTGPDARETSEFAGRFAALLDRAGAAQGAPVFGAEAAFLPPESAPFSPIREPDRLYDGRPPDTAPPSPLKAEESPESGEEFRKAEDSRADDGAEARREEAAAVFSGEAAESGAEGAAVKDRKAESAGNAENAANARGQAKQGREKAKIPGEDLEKIPGFEEGVLANAEPGINRGSVISGEPEEADDNAGAGVRLARSAKPEKTDAVEKPEKSDGKIPSGAVPAASLEDEAAAAEAAAMMERSAAELAGAEAAESAAGREWPEQGAEFLRDGTAAAAESGLESAAVELAALPRQQKPLVPERMEKEGREEPGEAGKGERRKLNLELRDFRTTPKAGGTAGGGSGTAENNGGRAPGDYTQNHGQEQEIIVDLKSQARSQAEVSYNRENRSQLSFRETLARELHENLNGDIVRHASIVLKNGGEGLIRLSLRPEHLGNVKIHLEMSENKVVGRIVVESNEALRAFEQELRSLEQAFRDSGFDGASLEMSVSADGGQGGAGSYRENGEETPFFSERLAAHSYDATSGIPGDSAMTRLFAGSGAERQVDVLA
jgi:flagellar hook-length control protein FliK